MQTIRMNLRKRAEIICGKNTMMRRALRSQIQKNPDLEALLPCIKGNVGLIFTEGDLKDVRKLVLENKVSAPATAGSVAPCDVLIPKGPTGLDPSQTSFMQALNIASKINRGQVEIMNDILLLKLGEKVTTGQAALLQKLKINPFSFGLIPLQIYESGSVFDPSVLDIEDDSILAKVKLGIEQISFLSLGLNYPSVCIVPLSIKTAYANVAALAVETSLTFDRVEKIKEYLADPEAFASQVIAAAPAVVADHVAAAAPVEEEAAPVAAAEAPAEEEEDDGGGLGGLFD